MRGLDVHDLVIRNGLVVDGTGASPFHADVGIAGEAISAVGPDVGTGREELDAEGLIVTPGFVDVHTHYDAQATWDPVLAPSSWHGITSIVMGNCGVGFAPARPDRHGWLMRLMAGVEDVPISSLEAGLEWDWESFPSYLDALERRRHTMDIGTQVPHGALRAYVMGARGARNEEAAPEDIAAMAEIVESAIRAGALGFSTSRAEAHRSLDNEVVPGTYAGRDELMAVAKAMARAGSGIFEWVSSLNPAAPDFALMEALSVEGGVPVSFVLNQSPNNEENWTRHVERVEAARAAGAALTAQVAPRGIGYLLGWQCSAHPFFTRASWRRIADLPWPAQLAALRDPGFRERLLGEAENRPSIDKGPLSDLVMHGWNMQFCFEDVPDYEPGPEKSIAAVAQARGMEPQAVAYDLMTEPDGQGLIYLPIVNYLEGNLNHVSTLFEKPYTLVSLSDGGAHCGAACDAGGTTFLLSYWARDRRGSRLTIEEAVRRQTSDTARFYGMHDRGVVAPGYLADLNLIDFDKLKLLRPYVDTDLPAGGRRLLQKAEGYVRTIKRGVTVFENGHHSGAFPGRLIRGVQPKPPVSIRASS